MLKSIYKFIYQVFRSMRYALILTNFGYVYHCPHNPSCGTKAIKELDSQGIVKTLYNSIFRVGTCIGRN